MYKSYKLHKLFLKKSKIKINEKKLNAATLAEPNLPFDNLVKD